MSDNGNGHSRATAAEGGDRRLADVAELLEHVTGAPRRSRRFRPVRWCKDCDRYYSDHALVCKLCLRDIEAATVSFEAALVNVLQDALADAVEKVLRGRLGPQP